MDILKRNIAPITSEAWSKIDAEASNVLRGVLAGRKVADVTEPKGWRCDAVSDGTLLLSDSAPVDGVNFGVREVMPLVEIRVPFTLPMWDLDDISRGCKTMDFSALQIAARQAALFEDAAVFSGLKDGGISGIEAESDNEPIEFALEGEALVKAVYAATQTLTARSVEGPYALVCSREVMEKIKTDASPYRLEKRLGAIVDKIILSQQYDTNFVTSLRGGDSEIAIGQDFSVGYQSHTNTEVTFYITETFTFRVFSPEAFVLLKPAK